MGDRLGVIGGAFLPVWAVGLALLGAGCGPETPAAPRGVERGSATPAVHRDAPLDLRINEVVSNNEGVWLDEQGEADDYVELFNPTKKALQLGDYALADKSGAHPLPALSLPPGNVQLFWADGTSEQGELHLPFKISADGETVRLLRGDVEIDRADVPALLDHHAYARQPDGVGDFVDCDWATPTRLNGKSCGPAASTSGDLAQSFAPYDWPEPWPATPGPLMISEARLAPADFVEVQNTSEQTLDLTQLELRLAPTNPRLAWPAPSDGVRLSWPRPTLAPGELLSVKVTDADLLEIAASANFEGVLSAFDADGNVIDRLEFSDWPAGASLAREPLPGGRLRFCNEASPGEPNEPCHPVESRPVSRYLHDLQTPGDFHALSSGHSTLGEESIEFLIDVEAGDTVVFLNSNDFLTHYNYVREVLEQQEPIDLCTPEGQAAYRHAWGIFIRDNFTRAEGRRYHLGSLVKHAGTDLSTVEFAPLNALTPEQLVHVFFTLMQHVPDPPHWAVRPMTPEHAERFRAAEGKLPLVSIDAPYRGVTFQPMVPGVAYGTLKFAASAELDSLPLGPRDIVLTDSIPNDIPLLAGLITETFQTPLSHVNVLSRGRGTPNMALLDGRKDPRVSALLGKLVRLEVSGFGFSLEPADPTEALDFWESHEPHTTPLVPRLDTSARGVVALRDRSLEDLPALGGKAAQLAELGHVELCEGTRIPDQAFAIPVVHSLEHYERSGAAALLAELRQDPAFLADPSVRARGLQRVRDKIWLTPIEPELRDAVVAAISERWPSGRVRFRSSSNVEDLAGFNGAGLYESEGVDFDGSAGGVDDAIHSVWASLWNERAFAERDYYSVDQSKVAMGVLVHPGFPSERANGVIVSRNVMDPALSLQTYINAQVGEALVTNPAPGIIADELIYDPTVPQSIYYQRSTFSPEHHVLTDEETDLVSCSAFAVHEHFQPLLDPEQKNSWFAMDLEFKLLGPSRDLLIKQARLYSFGHELPEGWCAP